MTDPLYLYKVTQATGSVQGGNARETHSREVVYCDYDRAEALRLYYHSEVTDH